LFFFFGPGQRGIVSAWGKKTGGEPAAPGETSKKREKTKTDISGGAAKENPQKSPRGKAGGGCPKGEGVSKLKQNQKKKKGKQKKG